MDANFSLIYVKLDGFVEVHKYGYLYFLILLTLYVLIICCNFIIVYLIWSHQHLHEPMYIFIATLSLNSFLLSTAVYPKLLIDVLSEEQVISYAACLFQFLMYYTLGGSDFYLLAAMAYDRYVSICKPLQYSTIMTNRTIMFLLFFSWVLPGLQVGMVLALDGNKNLCGHTLKGIFCNNVIRQLQCVTSREIPIFDFLVLINIVLLPVLFILFTYTKIVIVSYRSSKDVRRKAAETCLPHLFVLISYSCFCAYDVIVAEVKVDFPKIGKLIMSLQVVLYSPLFNPIIYGVKMKEISKLIQKMFRRVKLN